MRPRNNVDGFSPLPISRDIMTSENSMEAHDNADVYHELDYAGVRFRRIRDDMLNNVRANFRKFEDVFIDWNKECLQMSSSLLHQNVPTGLIEKPTLGKKIKEALEGLKEIEELGKKVNIKFGTVLKELSTKSGSNY